MAKVLTASEVAKMVMTMFPPTSRYLQEQTSVYGKDGNSVIHVKEFSSGCSKVWWLYGKGKTYGQLKAEEKRAMVEFITNLKVDIVTDVNKDGSVFVSYYVAGVCSVDERLSKYHFIKSTEIRPFNY